MSEPRPSIPSSASGSEDGRHRLAWWALALALISGGILRSVWIEDIEWKNDEQWSYVMSQEVGRSLPWPGVGMPTSLKFPNPGLSVWIFVPIGRMADTPTSMARLIVLLNMIGLIGFAVAVRVYLPPSEREPWLWGLALQAVSPYAIRLSRKIWPPSILTPLLLLLWISHRYRHARWGALLWGLVGALIGQVHLSGWYVAAGLVLGTAVAEYRGSLPRSCRWRYWLLGSVLGLIGTIPWVRALPGSELSVPAESLSDAVVLRTVGYAYSVIAAATSAFPFAFLGLGHETQDFFISPIIDGVPTHITEILILYFALALVVRIVVRLVRSIVAPGFRWARRRIAHDRGASPDGDASASGEPDHAGTEGASTRFYLWSTVAIPGALFLLTISVYFYHYFFVFCPFLFVLVASCMLPWRRVLLGMVIAQALISFSYLSYIHAKGGILHGEYGPTYARRVNR
ncbi:MAG: hypothetical protein ACLQGP_26775 [Isosphaeraceae bacterium]